MKRTIVQIVLLMSVIGFAIGWLGLSMRDIYREQAAQVQTVKPTPNSPLKSNPDPFSFGHPYFDPFTQNPTPALPSPPPPMYKTPVVCFDGDPCKQRGIWFL